MFFSIAVLLGLDVPIVAFFGKSHIDLYLSETRASHGLSLFEIVAMSNLWLISAGTSLREWTAISASFFNKDSSSSLIKRPFPPCCLNILSGTLSPEEVIGFNFIFASCFRIASTFLACISAKGLFLVAILIISSIFIIFYICLYYTYYKTM